MSTSNCICTEKKSPPSPESWDYPEWKDGVDNIKVFQRNGYFVVRGLISEEEIEDTKSAITGIVQKWFHQLKSKDATEEKDWEEIANRLGRQWYESLTLPLCSDYQLFKELMQRKTMSSLLGGCSGWLFMTSSLLSSVIIQRFFLS